jgi:hypothetical protein
VSSLLKSKLIIILGAIIILILVPAFKSNFNAPVTFYEWKQLDWNDFQGFVKPFTGWGAGISSNVYVDYDSTNSGYRAYAAMNNQLSWKKSSSTESDYLLNHEQYHFNISEFLARKLNRIIENKGLDTESEILPELSKIRTDLNTMQDEYDTQADHSLVRDLQRKWEFRIDSMLSSFNPDSGFITDFYSGAKILLPYNYEFIEGIHENQSTYRIYQLKKYDMTLAMTSFQYVSLSVESMTESLQEYYLNDSLQTITFQIDSISFDYQARVEAYDSIEFETTFHRWIHHNDYLYKITATFPENSDRPAYRDIATSFVNSFEIVNTDEFWIDRFEKSESEIIISTSTPLKEDYKDDKNVASKCATYGDLKQYGFYAKPIFRNDGALLIPFRVVEHADSLIQEVMLLHNNEWYSYEQEPEDQIFFLPEENLDTDIISVNFGYLLKEDSVNKCYTFYYQNLEINRQITGDKLNEQAEL